jgi:hypothetical protein
MHPAYFETRFKLGLHVGDLPDDFAIVTAYQPTGKKWPIERNSFNSSSVNNSPTDEHDLSGLPFII